MKLGQFLIDRGVMLTQLMLGLVLAELPHHTSAQTSVFSDITAISGVSFITDHELYGNGVSVYDWNKDGYPDISLAATGTAPVFYLNNLDGTFTEVWFQGIDNTAEAKSIQWLDYNNDGNPDLFITRCFAPWSLYENDGSYGFTDVTNSVGLGQLSVYMTMGSSWADIDLDGLLDLYICNYNTDATNRMFLNNGNFGFTDITISSGTSDGMRPSFQAVFADFNMDGLPDLHVSNDREQFANSMYLNEGAGVFEDFSSYAGIDINIEAMSNTVGDFDNDGDLDIYESNGELGNYLLMNLGDSTFANIAESAGVEINEFCWGAQWMDQDLDGNLDLFVGTHTLNPGPSTYNHIFLNNSDMTFTEPNSTGFEGDYAISFASAIADFDQDGDYDIVVTSDDPGRTTIWRNNNEENYSLTISLQGTESNLDAIGATVRCYTNGICQLQELRCGEAHLAQNSQYLIFGKGTAPTMDSVTVTWPSGIVDKLYNVSGSREHIVEGSTTVTVSSSDIESNRISVMQLRDCLTLRGAFPNNLALYDLNGRIVSTSNNNFIDTSTFPSGIYVLVASIENSTQSVFKVFIP